MMLSGSSILNTVCLFLAYKYKVCLARSIENVDVSHLVVLQGCLTFLVVADFVVECQPFTSEVPRYCTYRHKRIVYGTARSSSPSLLHSQSGFLQERGNATIRSVGSPNCPSQTLCHWTDVLHGSLCASSCAANFGRQA